ncbi:hypothetical protein ACQP1W_51960 [Spirillospora sp. CA-255316]
MRPGRRRVAVHLAPPGRSPPRPAGDQAVLRGPLFPVRRPRHPRTRAGDPSIREAGRVLIDQARPLIAEATIARRVAEARAEKTEKTAAATPDPTQQAAALDEAAAARLALLALAALPLTGCAIQAGDGSSGTIGTGSVIEGCGWPGVGPRESGKQ